jgi:hypothetical protein
VVQDGGVGMMMLGGMVGAGAEDTAGGAAQEDSKKRKTNGQTRKVFIRRMIFLCKSTVWDICSGRLYRAVCLKLWL